MPERHQLTELQLAILRVVWDKGEATVQDIWEAMHPERGLAQTTIATMLSRLERRGVVTRRAQARQYHYKAAVTEPEVQHSMVAELTERLFDGDIPPSCSTCSPKRTSAPATSPKSAPCSNASKRSPN